MLNTLRMRRCGYCQNVPHKPTLCYKQAVILRVWPDPRMRSEANRSPLTRYMVPLEDALNTTLTLERLSQSPLATGDEKVNEQDCP